MTKTDRPIGNGDEAGWYQIRLKGHPDARWGAWFDSLTLTHQGDGTSVISGAVADQAALHGLLHKVRDIGLPLVSVIRVDADQPDALTTHPFRAINQQQETK